MSLFDPTQDAIARNPLPRNWRAEPRLIGAWITIVAPCVVQGIVQDAVVWKDLSEEFRRVGRAGSAKLDSSLSGFSA